MSHFRTEWRSPHSISWSYRPIWSLSHPSTFIVHPSYSAVWTSTSSRCRPSQHRKYLLSSLDRIVLSPAGATHKFGGWPDCREWKCAGLASTFDAENPPGSPEQRCIHCSNLLLIVEQWWKSSTTAGLGWYLCCWWYRNPTSLQRSAQCSCL